MKWAEMKNIVGKFVVIRYFTSGAQSQLGVFKVKNYRDFASTYKVLLAPSSPFKETFPGNYDIYSMDLAGMLNENNVFNSYQKAKTYYDSING